MKSKHKTPFALRVQTILIITLLACFVLMMQTWSQGLFIFATVLLIVASIIQIDFGNINPDYGFGKTVKAFLKILLIVIAVFGSGMLLAPYLVNLKTGAEFVKTFMIILIAGTFAGFLLALFIRPKKKRG